jgi:hypothetical protein
MAQKRVHQFIFWDAVDCRSSGGPPEDQSNKVWGLCPNGVMDKDEISTLYSIRNDGMMMQMDWWNTLSEQKCGTFNWEYIQRLITYCVYTKV